MTGTSSHCEAGGELGTSQLATCDTDKHNVRKEQTDFRGVTMRSATIVSGLCKVVLKDGTFVNEPLSTTHLR